MRQVLPEGLTKSADHEGGTSSPILLIAGFGDNVSMYAPLFATPLAQTHSLIALDLPGFGAPALEGTTSLSSLAIWLADMASDFGAHTVVAHSVASIAAERPGSPISRIISLEGNLTAEDAYFSGTAADFETPEAFRDAFLERLTEMVKTEPVIARYREAVSKADPLALWQLGTDARAFSERQVPGEILARSAHVTYIYNPENCPEASLRWLAENPMECVVLDQASHWSSVDQPGLLAEQIAVALASE